MSSDEILIVSTKEELLSFGYLFTNVGKEVIYDGHTFLLKQCGIRQWTNAPFMGYPTIKPQKPSWNLYMSDLTLTVSNISI